MKLIEKLKSLLFKSFFSDLFRELEEQRDSVARELNTLHRDYKKVVKDKDSYSEKLGKLNEEYKSVISKIDLYSEKLDKLTDVYHEVITEKTKYMNQLDLINSVFSVKLEPNKKINQFIKVFHDDFRHFAAEEDACADEAEAFAELLEVENQLIAYSASSEFNSRQIIAVSGGFSSGKSSFLNSLLSPEVKIRLPEGVKPTTAIPMYIMQTNDKQEIKGITESNGSFIMKDDLFYCLHHEFLKRFSFNLSKYLPYIFIRTYLENKNLNNICFIDTPGYNNSDGEVDLNVALDFIDKAQSMIWCIGIDAGTLPESDKQLLCDIQEKYPKLKIYFIITKAELKSPSIKKEIFENIKESLEDADIVYEGISVYSSKQKQEFMFDKICLNDYLFQLNVKNHELAKSIYKKVENVYQKYLIAEIEERKKAENSIEILYKTVCVLYASQNELESYISKEMLETRNFNNESTTSNRITGLEDTFSVLQKTIADKVNNQNKYKIYETKAKQIFGEMKQIVLDILGYDNEDSLLRK